jgi:hypothetical protein
MNVKDYINDTIEQRGDEMGSKRIVCSKDA